MGDNPSRFSGCDDCPVEKVSWGEVRGFVGALNDREKVTVYRLPTEAEWEYAARAGTQTAYHFGDAVDQLRQYAWYGDSSGNGQTHPVGRKEPNQFGLYDMHGNVWEWVADWYKGNYPSGAVTDPRGPSFGTRRVNRGGGWHNLARHCRAADRGHQSSGYRADAIGFRLARTP